MLARKWLFLRDCGHLTNARDLLNAQPLRGALILEFRRSARTLPGIFLIVFLISNRIIFIISITIIFVVFSISITTVFIGFSILLPPRLLVFLFLSSLCLFVLYFITAVFIFFYFCHHSIY